MYLRSIPKRGLVFLLWTLVLGFTVLNAWLVLQSLKPAGFLDTMVIALAMVPFTLYGWYTVLIEVNSWEVDADTVRVRDFAGLRTRRFSKLAVIRWAEKRKSTRYNHWKELQVRTERGKFRLLSSGVHNYEDLKHALLKGVPADLPEPPGRAPFAPGRFYARIGLVLLVPGIAWAMVDLTALPANGPEPACMQSVLSANPVHETGSRNSAWMLFPVHRYPQIEFGIANNDGTYQSAAINDMRLRLHKGDTLTLCMDSVDYALHITKTRQPDFWDRASGSNHIRVLGIRDKKWVYLDPADVRKWERHQPGPWILLLLFGAIFLMVSLVGHIQKRSAKNRAYTG